ncbi:MAG: hypothetical protein Q8Q12_06320 [bacterium]|nr:hypothetical protein [bacterium]
MKHYSLSALFRVVMENQVAEAKCVRQAPGRRRELKIKEFASTIGVSSRTVKRWAEAGIIPVVKRRTARGHVRTRITEMPLGQYIAVDGGQVILNAFLRKAWSDFWRSFGKLPPKKVHKQDTRKSIRFARTYDPRFLEEVFLGATNWENVGRMMRQLVKNRVLLFNQLVYCMRPERYMTTLSELLPEERLSRLSAVSLTELQDLVQTLTPKQRQILKVMLRLQQENPGAPPSKSDVWRACKNDPLIGKMSRTTFWRYMKHPTLRLFLERLYEDRDNSVPSLSSNHRYAT